MALGTIDNKHIKNFKYIFNETLKFDTILFDSIDNMDEYIKNKDYKDK